METIYAEQRGQGACVDTAHGQRANRKSSPARSSVNIDIQALATAIKEAAQTSTRQPPKYLIELPQYNGRSDEWLTYKATFTQTRDSFTAAENVFRLRRSLKGTALEAVSALLITQANPDDIIKALERRFGRPEILILAEMEKVKSLPRVTDNPRDLCIFANKISNIVAAVEVLNMPQYLHSPEMLRSAVEKLSTIQKSKWYDYAAMRTDYSPELKKLTDFLNYEADKCAAYALPEAENERPARKRMERSYVTYKRDGRCPACKKDHQLPDCPSFLNADVNTRWEMTKEHKICFRCLRSTHRRITCRARACGVNNCMLRHHKLLHLPKRPENVASNQHEQPPPSSKPTIHEEVLTSTIESTNATEGPRIHRRAYLKVAQVTLIGPKGQRDTFALLDEGSTVSIIDSELAEALGLDGPTEPMTIQGVNGSETLHNHSKRVTAKIKGKYEDEIYDLRDARTADNVTLFTQTVRARDIEGCEHIQDIKEELIYENATPTILIGQDNWELIVSRAVRNGPRHQPVASHTQLGWVLHGCRTSHTYPVMFCAHLNTAERAHDRLEEIMKKHFELESLGIEPRRQGSDPEQLAINILEKKSRRLPDGRYETGLLCRDENAKIPNNYEDTLKRLKGLEKKLDRDENLKRKYKERVENLLKSNYAERATAPPTGGRTWYLPHFTVVNELSQRLWIVRIRPAVKEVLKSCPQCRLRKAKPASPSTGNLPAARLAHHERPFTFTGLDYFGPLEVTVNRHREKRYVALFTCMTSRAVHLEVVASLSTDSAINVLRRFIARRGCPTELWRDNATCFRSANRELANAWRAPEVEASNRRITWRFLPPAAPFMAGAWERMVRTVKEALKVTLREQHPSDETLVTLLAEVEATVNSRPLTHVAVTPDAPPALTPNTILLGPNCYVPAPGTFEESDVNARAHWRRAQRLADIFWRRWVREYLPLLQHRREPNASGVSPKLDDLVVICDSNLPRNTWPRGRVTGLYPGKDGEVRVVDVTTSSGRVLRRPTKRIVVLPVDSQDATAGECSRRDA